MGLARVGVRLAAGDEFDEQMGYSPSSGFLAISWHSAAAASTVAVGQVLGILAANQRLSSSGSTP